MITASSQLCSTLLPMDSDVETDRLVGGEGLLLVAEAEEDIDVNGKLKFQ